MSVELTTSYLGIELKNPLVAGASPLTANLESLKLLEQAGAAAVVMPTLFEEQIEHEQWAVHQLHEFLTESFAESLDFHPEHDNYNTGPDSYLRTIETAKHSLSVPVIASLNGSSADGWIRYAQMIQDAGADALELDVHLVPTDMESGSQPIETHYLDLVSSVRESISIPLSVKIGPYFSSLPHVANRLVDAGADGLVLFNRYLQPDIDLETLDVVPHLVLDQRQELHLRLRWIAILHRRLQASLAAYGGIHEVHDVIKAMLVGADATMMGSALLERGPRHLRDVLDQLQAWMTEREYESVAQMKGSVSWKNCVDPRAYERSSYMKALITYSGRNI